MPPKKSASAASKTTKTNGVKKSVAETKKAATNGATKDSTKSSVKTSPKTATKSTTKSTKAPAKPAASRKRKSDDDEEEPETNGTTSKRQKKAPVSRSQQTPARDTASSEPASPVTKPTPTKKSAASKKPKAAKPKSAINDVPTQLLDLYTFGGGESGELGFAGAKGTKEIRRPRLNPYLTADKAGVVQFSVGGMHTACLTHDNKILTWGVNDQGALGRDTTWDGGLKDMQDADKSDDDDDSDSDEGEINPHESTPGEVDMTDLGKAPVFTQVCATDSATFALTDQGLVYGWGTFRSNEGIFGFSKETLIQHRPVLVENLKNIKKLAAGANHVLALDDKGVVFAWGAGQQHQLGRRILERHQISSLTPAKFGLRGKMSAIGAGAYHSFAVANNGNVYSWGLNSFGQTGAPIDVDGTGVHLATKIDALAPNGHGRVIQIVGGSHHSIAVTESGEALAFGRLDGFQTGLKIPDIPEEDVVRDANNKPRILTVPTKIPDINAVAAGAGSDHSIVVDKNGKAYSFGFNEYGQAGVGTTEDVETATLIDNTAVRGKQVVLAECGGQFSVLATVHQAANGVNGHA